ncbi:MAG: ABC transporter ATP-binding protein [Thermodesulfobacteriota bacterium]|nr:ABC transporter ATP-binding protein [Thermodesulfobacteriota bacterium]
MARNIPIQQTPELSVSGINKKFGKYQALSDVSFEVIPGEILGLIGPNGSGKSTLLECITGLLPVESGTISRQSRQLSLKKRKQVLWYQPDNILPFAEQQVTTTLSFFQHIHGVGTMDLEQVVNKLELAPMLHKPLKALSKGYRRRVLLALALLSRQPLLMLDEPFDGFDLRQSLAVMDLLRECRAGRTMILSIHQLTEAEKICDRFLLLDQGRVLGIGTLDELRRQSGLTTDATLEEVFLAIT